MAKTATRTTNAPLEPPKPLDEAQVVEWLNYSRDEILIYRDDEVIPDLVRLATVARIEDDKTAGDFSDHLRRAKALLGEARRLHSVDKHPYLEGGRVVDRWYRAFAEPLTNAIENTDAILLDYMKRLREEQVRQIAEALDQAPLFSQEREKLERAAAKPKIDVRGKLGTKPSIKVDWKPVVRDFAAVPDEYKCIDDAKVKVAMHRRDPVTNKPVAEIPGIEWVSVDSLSVR